jgi:hypothetical protein
MIEKVVILSLMITAVYTLFQEGNLLSPVRIWGANILDRSFGLKWSRYIQKPLWDCLPCMASVWGILLSWSFDVRLLLAVCGVNVIVSRFVFDDDEPRAQVIGFDFSKD